MFIEIVSKRIITIRSRYIIEWMKAVLVSWIYEQGEAMLLGNYCLYVIMEYKFLLNNKIFKKSFIYGITVINVFRKLS